MDTKGSIIAIAVLIIIVAVVALVGMRNSTTTAPLQSLQTTTVQQQSNVNQSLSAFGPTRTPIVLTDPPQAPAGTQAAVMSYSGVMVETRGASGTAWVAANGSGSLDLLSIENSGQVIGYADIAANTTIRAVTFVVNSATITVNGTVYNVTVPYSTVNTTVSSNAALNQSSAVVVDFTPTFAATYKHNVTSFVMTPSSKAALVANAGVSENSNVGANVALNANAQASLAAAAPNITITSASIAVSGNVTTISVVVADNSKTQATLNNLVIYGEQNVTASPSVGLNISVKSNVNASGVVGNGSSINGGLGGIASKGSTNAQLKALTALAVNIASFSAINLLIKSDGSVIVPKSSADAQGIGYVVSPGGGTATMKFVGAVEYNSGTIIAKPVAGSVYRIVVTSREGATAATNVTAI